MASSPAQFSAGPELREDGAEYGRRRQGPGAYLICSCAGRAAIPNPNLLAQAYAAPTSTATCAKPCDLRTHTRAPVPPNPRWAMKVSGAPDPRFNGRDVYMMAIQMPNLTSYSGKLADVVRGSYGARSGARPDCAAQSRTERWIPSTWRPRRPKDRGQSAAGLRHRKGRPRIDRGNRARTGRPFESERRTKPCANGSSLPPRGTANPWKWTYWSRFRSDWRLRPGTV